MPFQNSLWCFTRLSENGLTGKGKWTPKLKGDAPGIILHGDNEHDGKIFVKQLDINECLNFSTLALAKQCGVKSPRVEVKFLANTYYLFSFDMNREEKNKTYHYSDLSDYYDDSSNFIDFKQFTLFQGRTLDGKFNSYLKIDKVGVARFFLMSILLGLTDLHLENVGLVISRNENSFKAKIALIDLNIDRNRKVDFSIFQNSISDFVIKYNLTNSLSTEKYLFSFAEYLNDNDYLLAFKKIQDHFPSAHANLKEVTYGVLNNLLEFCNDYQRKKIEAMRGVYSQTWYENFSQLSQKMTLVNNSMEPLNF